jgi:hypothetical protein
MLINLAHSIIFTFSKGKSNKQTNEQTDATYQLLKNYSVRRFSLSGRERERKTNNAIRGAAYTATY